MDEQNQNSLGNPPKKTDTDSAIAVVLSELLKEQKRTRNTDTAFRIINLLLFIFLPIAIIIALVAGTIAGVSSLSGEIGKLRDEEAIFSSFKGDNVRHTALIEFTGVISEGVIDPDRIIAAIQRGFENKKSVGVILRINSPGGSPTISDNLYTGIKALRAKYPQKPFMVVTGDVCASGGYYVAVAGDKIFVNQSSIVGSIGVIHMGMGVKSLMEKVGVTPRIITSGDRKAILSPFEDLKPADREHLQKSLDAIHKRFIEVVREGRGDRLKSQDVFNGLFWAGEEAVALGLVDGIGSVQEVAKTVIGEENIVKYPVRKFDLESLFLDQIKSFISGSFGDFSGAGVGKGSFRLY